MVTDKITITIELERLNKEIPRINNLIERFTFDLEKVEGVKVLNHSKIETKFIGKEKREDDKRNI